MVSCIFVQNDDGNLNVPYLIENDGQVNLNWNWLDNNWNVSNPALRLATLFILSLEESFLLNLSLPTTKHAPNLVQYLSERARPVCKASVESEILHSLCG